MKLSLKEFRDVVQSVLREADPNAPAAGSPAPGAPPAPAAGGPPPAPAGTAPAPPQATPIIADIQAIMTAVTKALGSAQDGSTKLALSNVNKTLQGLLQNVPK